VRKVLLEYLIATGACSHLPPWVVACSTFSFNENVTSSAGFNTIY